MSSSSAAVTTVISHWKGLIKKKTCGSHGSDLSSNEGDGHEDQCEMHLRDSENCDGYPEEACDAKACKTPNPSAFQEVDDKLHDDREILTGIFQQVREVAIQRESYRDMLAFLTFAALYCAVLYLQGNSFATYEVTTAHYGILPQGITGNAPFVFNGPSDMYSWLNSSLIQGVWQDPPCGDGFCSPPIEVPAWGPVGCAQDCGVYTKTTGIVVTILTSFNSTLSMASSSWNLCMLSPISVCWYTADQTFTELESTSKFEMAVPDGTWAVNVNAPFGGLAGYVLKAVPAEGVTLSGLGSGQELATWGQCFSSSVAALKSPLYQCRSICATISLCMPTACTGAGEAQMSGVFVDCAGICNTSPENIRRFANKTCTEIVRMSQALIYLNFQCNLTSAARAIQTSRLGYPHRRRLQSIVAKKYNSDIGVPGGFTMGSYPAYSGESRVNTFEDTMMPSPYPSLADMALEGRALEATTTDPVTITASREDLALDAASVATTWQLLGATDSLRVNTVQVATLRALYTWVGTTCLNQANLSVSAAPRFAAFFCAWLGGPASEPGCNYTSRATGRQLVAEADLREEMALVHSRLGVAQDQQKFFVAILVAAFAATTQLTDAETLLITRRFHELDPPILEPGRAIGCRPADVELNWQVDSQYTITIAVNEMVQWTWTDEEPHSIRTAGVGDVPGETFTGMGAGRLVVSRGTACTPFNTGPGNLTEEPVPCVLQVPHFTALSLSNVFSYAKTFEKVGNYSFECARYQGRMSGTIQVVEKAAAPVSALGQEPESHECAPGCQLHALRNGLCDPVCSNQACAFDGGDCSCSVDVNGLESCTCPQGQSHGLDGACCDTGSIGTGLSYNFSVKSYGPDPNITDLPFIPQGDDFTLRSIGERNRVLIGMLITTSRWGNRLCHHRFDALQPHCAYGISTAPYGVNPVFLPSSSLYDSQAAQNLPAYYPNTSAAINPSGLPYGFVSQPSKSLKDTYSFILDVDLSNQDALDRLQYLQDGFFTDAQTKEVAVQLLTYNSDTQLITSSLVSMQFQSGGKIAVKYSVDAVDVVVYSGSGDYLRLALELLVVAFVLADIHAALLEVRKAKQRQGAYNLYLRSAWNYIDWASISIFVASIGLWVYYVIEAQAFTIHGHYNLYNPTFARTLYWQRLTPDTDYQAAEGVFFAVQTMLRMRAVYTALNGINIFIMVLRLLKLMDFQPRLGIITRTLSNAAPELLHFFLIWAIIFMGYALFGNLVFGRSIDQFRSLPSSMVACLNIMLTDTSINDYLLQLQGAELAAGIVFFWSYVLFVVFILLNIVIAIIVDAFMEVKADATRAPLMPTELVLVVRDWVKFVAGSGPFRSTDRIMRYLRRLGAENRRMHKHARLVSSDSASNSRAEMAPTTARRETLRVNGEELDAEQLTALIERSAQRKAHSRGQGADRAGPPPGGLPPADPVAVAEELVHYFGVKSKDFHGPPTERGSDEVKELLLRLLENVDGMKAQISSLEQRMEEERPMRTAAAVAAEITAPPGGTPASGGRGHPPHSG